MIDLEEGGFLIMEKINEVPGQVSFGRALKDFFIGYIDFKGRTTRAGYWWMTLILMIISFVPSSKILDRFSSLYKNFLFKFKSPSTTPIGAL